MDPRRQRCPYEDCQDFGRAGGGNVIAFGTTRQGRKRFLCHTCQRTFCENAGSVFRRLRTERERVVEAARWFAQGWDIPRIAHRLHVQSRTVRDWLSRVCSTPCSDAGADWGLTREELDDLRARLVPVKGRGSTRAGGGGQADDIRFMSSVSR